MALDPWQLTGAGPDSYERYQVPSVFAPLARLFLDRVRIEPGQQLLDVACGTGVIAREASERIGPHGAITGVDINAQMLDIAREQAPAGAARIAWRQADAAALPFDDGVFDLVLCQQGLQFFPDKLAALREMRRVLKPGGRLGLCVWRDVGHSPCHAAIAAAVARSVGSAAARRFLAPFAFGDAGQLREVILAAGFRNAEIEVATLMRRLLPPAESIPGLLASTPVGPDIAALDVVTRQGIVEEATQALAAYRDEDGLRVPQPTHIAQAVR